MCIPCNSTTHDMIKIIFSSLKLKYKSNLFVKINFSYCRSAPHSIRAPFIRLDATQHQQRVLSRLPVSVTRTDLLL